MPKAELIEPLGAFTDIQGNDRGIQAQEVEGGEKRDGGDGKLSRDLPLFVFWGRPSGMDELSGDKSVTGFGVVRMKLWRKGCTLTLSTELQRRQ